MKRRDLPQWSPVMKTGNTGRATEGRTRHGRPQWSPVMKTGNTPRPATKPLNPTSLNGARS